MKTERNEWLTDGFWCMSRCVGGWVSKCGERANDDDEEINF